jgi:NAD(P)-dependent dehydrogenase (short-subunit alcohol dehydrogenase family)
VADTSEEDTGKRMVSHAKQTFGGVDILVRFQEALQKYFQTL